MEIINKDADDLIKAEYNPRKISEKELKDLRASIDKFGLVEPVVVNTHKGREGVVVGGHQRLRVMLAEGWTEIPCVEVDLSLKDEKELNIRLNKSGGEFDFELLSEHFEIDDLLEFGFDSIEFDDMDDGEGSGDIPDEVVEQYTKKVTSPNYEPTGEKPTIDELVDYEKTASFIKKIKASNVDEATRKFLVAAARRHNVFNYKKIAEFYAHADKETQDLMEQSALVIIDFKKAIENGYIQLRDEVAQQFVEDKEDD